MLVLWAWALPASTLIVYALGGPLLFALVGLRLIKCYVLSLTYPAASSREQDKLLRLLRSSRRFTTVDMSMGHMLPRHVPVRRHVPSGP